MKKNNNSARSVGRPVEEGPVHIASWRARSEDLLDRHRLLTDFIADEEWMPLWREAIREVARLMAGWPQHMAATIGRLEHSSEDARLYSWTVQWSWPAMVDGVVSMLGLHVEYITRAPSPLDLPELEIEPDTSAEARREWLDVRTRYTKKKIASRRHHRRRSDLRFDLENARFLFRSALVNVWLTGATRYAGDEAGARAFAENLIRESLERLAKLSGDDISDLLVFVGGC